MAGGLGMAATGARPSPADWKRYYESEWTQLGVFFILWGAIDIPVVLAGGGPVWVVLVLGALLMVPGVTLLAYVAVRLRRGSPPATPYAWNLFLPFLTGWKWVAGGLAVFGSGFGVAIFGMLLSLGQPSPSGWTFLVPVGGVVMAVGLMFAWFGVKVMRAKRPALPYNLRRT